MGPSTGDRTSASSESHVLIIITGGTICMQDSPDGLVPTQNFVQNCLQPSPDFNDGSSPESTIVTNERGESVASVTIRSPLRSQTARRRQRQPQLRHRSRSLPSRQLTHHRIQRAGRSRSRRQQRDRDPRRISIYSRCDCGSGGRWPADVQIWG